MSIFTALPCRLHSAEIEPHRTRKQRWNDNRKTITPLETAARRIRRHLVSMSHRARAAHLGSALSCVDILVAAYGAVLHIDPRCPDDPGRDRMIFSKGHAVAALYATLAEFGFMSAAELDGYGRAGSRLEEHPGPATVPGVEIASGSLGHGLSMAAGLALAGRIQRRSYRVLALLSDGECNEGSVWEAAMFAAAQRLENLVAIIDFNRWQATGRSCRVMALDPLAAKWAAFGWHAVEVDGHDIAALIDVFTAAPPADRPLAVVAHTVKGKGVSFMEDDNNWHYRIPTAEEVARAHRELGQL